ncbi:MAG: VCBS repeat-containing protein [Alphaproteobacteria bacterium]|nr:VCBS repeat-containing protein [Alphaproteobacteria bacterium]
MSRHPNTLLLLLAVGALAGCENQEIACEPTPIEDTGSDISYLEPCDGLDNDEDGRVDEGWPDYDGDGVNECAPPDEACNYRDDDYDGFVDEGFDDLNGDGIPDCDECFVSEPLGAAIAPTCGGASYNPVGTPTVEFQWPGLDLFIDYWWDDSPAPALVSPMYDDDGDGVVTGDDRPLVAWRGSHFFIDGFGDRDVVGAFGIIDSDCTGTTAAPCLSDNFRPESQARAFIDDLAPEGSHAVADLDVDGFPDIVMVGFNGAVQAWSADGGGSLVWFSDTPVRVPLHQTGGSEDETPIWPVQPTVADLDGDGFPEVIAYNQILAGEDGALLVDLDVNTDVIMTMPAIGDIDLDGVQEILIGGDCFEADGTFNWSTGVLGDGGDGGEGHWNAIVQADSDDEAEIVAIGGGEFGLYEHDGSETVRVTPNPAVGPVAGPPCVADFDNDGQPEVAWTTIDDLVAFELDGTELWRASNQGVVIEDNGGRYLPNNTDPSTVVQVPAGWAGCSAFDFDNDGGYEILVADEKTFYVIDGATGAALFTWADHNSETAFSYPTVADWDQDGSAEILIAGSNVTDTTQISSLTVLGDPSNGWAPAGPGWQLHDYAATNIGAAGEVPGPEATYWLDAGVYRARPGVAPEPDLSVEIVDVCVEPCDLAANVALVSVQVSNGGSETVAEVEVAIYGLDSGGSQIIELTDPGNPFLFTNVQATHSSDAQVFEFPSSTIAEQGIAALLAVVDPYNESEECDESNNESVWDPGTDLCP